MLPCAAPVRSTLSSENRRASPVSRQMCLSMAVAHGHHRPTSNQAAPPTLLKWHGLELLPQTGLPGSVWWPPATFQLCPGPLLPPDPPDLVPSRGAEKGMKPLQLDPFQELFPSLGTSPALLLTCPSQQISLAAAPAKGCRTWSEISTLETLPNLQLSCPSTCSLWLPQPLVG